MHVTVERRARLGEHSTYVFVSNHQNSMDILLLAEAIPCPFGFVAKAALRNVPFIGWSLRMSPSVFVDLRNPRRSRESIETAAKEIREGRSVAIFPEGHRTQGPQMSPFKKTAFLLAVAAGVPLVPITITNAYTVLNEHRRWARPGPVHVVLHEPIPTEGLTRTDVPRLTDEVFAVIASEVAQGSLEPS
jgi:1-acyl-sn-glycerol-3-phosphate acyltransferase